VTDFFWFSERQWSRMGPLLLVNCKGARRVHDHYVLSGIVHTLQSGRQWGDCLSIYGPKKTLYNRFVRWAERGIWEGIFSALGGADGVLDRTFIDSICIKAHRSFYACKADNGLYFDDDGPGIAAEHKEKVFDVGERLDRPQLGTGLGLAIVRDLALHDRSNVELLDSPLGGLRAKLNLPVQAR
jgi:transposase